MKISLYKHFVYSVQGLIKVLDILLKKFFNKNEFLPNIHDAIEKRQYRSIIVNNQNISFFVPSTLSNWRIDNFFTKEPETLNWIDNFKIQNSEKIIFWDIGANIGQYSIYAALKFKDIEIISFEPSTSNTRILSRNISLNQLYDKINIFPLALSDKENVIASFNETMFKEGGSMTNFESNTDYVGNKLLDDKIKNRYNIFGTSIDSLITNKIIDVPNYIKIDVDGIEHLVLNGAKNLLKNPNLKELSIEMNPDFSDQYNFIDEIMKDNGFKKISSTNARLINSKYKRHLNEAENAIFKRT
ncbi:FkbM family methyltransferase [Candidatus Pelagibacter sp.]|nr:FkbM family methyltransferase [Candidatus Pelagibacter sp.]